MDWKVLYELDAGGQGRACVVKKSAVKDPIDDLVGHLRAVGGVGHRFDESTKAPFRKALIDVVRPDEQYVKKTLIDPTEESKFRLHREAQVYESISDPHLLAIVDKGPTWMVTEFQPGGTLEKRLENYRGKVLDTLDAIRPLVAVLSKMHSAGFVHRDFKPANIFIGREKQLVLGDAGLAFYLGDDKRVTKTYESVGTKAYMPPWAYGRRLKDIQPTFDVYSVGKVIWAMIAGHSTSDFWFIDDEDYPDDDLTNKFPDDESVHWVNWLLKQCVVKTEDQMQLRDGAQLGAQLDRVIDAIRNGCVTPNRVRNNVKRVCRVCGIGTYAQAIKPGEPAATSGFLAFYCNDCGHEEKFWRAKS